MKNYERDTAFDPTEDSTARIDKEGDSSASTIERRVRFSTFKTAYNKWSLVNPGNFTHVRSYMTKH